MTNFRPARAAALAMAVRSPCPSDRVVWMWYAPGTVRAASSAHAGVSMTVGFGGRARTNKKTPAASTATSVHDSRFKTALLPCAFCLDYRPPLARSAAAVRGRAAVGIDDDLAAGDAGVAVRAADDEASGRIDQDAGLAVHHLLRNHLVHDLLGDVFPERVVADRGAVLSGDDDGVDAD